MKRHHGIFFAVLFISSIPLTAIADRNCELPPMTVGGISECRDFGIDGEDDVEISVEHVFVPKGFDSNDNSEVVLTGWMPTTCFRSPRGEFKRNGNVLEMSVRATQYHGRDRMCIEMAVPFLITLPLGKLEEGLFSIHLTKGEVNAMGAEIRIEASNSASVDDYVYAKVEHVEIDSQTHKAILSGSNPSDCVELDRIAIVSNELDTYAVMPIMKQVKTDCPRKLVPFHYELDLPNSLHAPKTMLHVRSLEGKSVNVVY